MKGKILLVEDEATLSMIVADMLRREGYEVMQARDGVEGLPLFEAERPDAVIADVMMPRMDGFQMVKRLRKADDVVPVLFLTARGAIDDIVAGLELGANDYLKKPFSMQELLARLKALLRRRHQDQEELEIGSYRLRVAPQQLVRGTQARELTHFEVLILKELAMHKNEPVEASRLMKAVWQNDDPYNLNRLHGFIFKLRRYLAADPEVAIINLRGIGYKLKA